MGNYLWKEKRKEVKQVREEHVYSVKDAYMHMEMDKMYKNMKDKLSLFQLQISIAIKEIHNHNKYELLSSLIKQNVSSLLVNEIISLDGYHGIYKDYIEG